jgi:hypothetical protein
MSGTCAEKALEQHLCERFYYSYIIHIFILIDLITSQTQILRSRGFDAYVSDTYFIQMHFLGYPSLVLQCLHTRLLISLPRYFLHDGHFQFKALKPMNAAMMMICVTKIVFFENTPKISDRV